MRGWPLPLLLAAAACAGHAPGPAAGPVPPFAAIPYEPFSRAAAIAIALREWRLFGMPSDDALPGSRALPGGEAKPERVEGLWQRVGEYWWEGLGGLSVEAGWTGKHDANGQAFPPSRDANFAWSAVFISYVMRIAGAGPRFPYAAAHAAYINAARLVPLGRATWAISAERPTLYAPQPGDLICMSRSHRPMSYDDLPAGGFPAHCDIVVGREAAALDVLGGNVDDAVTLKHVPVTPEGTLADADGHLRDARYPWFVVIRVLYDR